MNNNSIEKWKVLDRLEHLSGIFYWFIFDLIFVGSVICKCTFQTKSLCNVNVNSESEFMWFDVIVSCDLVIFVLFIRRS